MAQRPKVTDRDELAQKIQPVILGADYSCYAYVRAFWEAYHVRSSSTRFGRQGPSRAQVPADYHVEEASTPRRSLIPLLKRVGDQLCVEGGCCLPRDLRRLLRAYRL